MCITTRSYSIQNWLKISSHSTNIQFKSILHQVVKNDPLLLVHRARGSYLGCLCLGATCICCGVETRCTELFFVQPGVKVNGDYYREVLLKEKLLPCIKEISSDNFIVQPDSAPAHRARDTMALLRRETPDFISPDQWPQTAQIWTLWIIRSARRSAKAFS